MMTIEEIQANIAATRGANGGRPFMLTCSGSVVDLVDPKPEQIKLTDLAHHLSRIGRYTGGFNRDSYPVSQHLLLALAIAVQDLNDQAPIVRYSAEYYDQLLAVVLHDGEEFAFNDVSSPVKAAMSEPNRETLYKQLAVNMRRVIYEAFDVDWAYHNDCVLHADLNALVTERYLLLPEANAWPRVRADQIFCRSLPEMTPSQAQALWLKAVRDLVAARDLARIQEEREDAIAVGGRTS